MRKRFLSVLYFFVCPYPLVFLSPPFLFIPPISFFWVELSSSSILVFWRNIAWTTHNLKDSFLFLTDPSLFRNWYLFSSKQNSVAMLSILYEHPSVRSALIGIVTPPTPFHPCSHLHASAHTLTSIHFLTSPRSYVRATASTHTQGFMVYGLGFRV